MTRAARLALLSLVTVAGLAGCQSDTSRAVADLAATVHPRVAPPATINPTDIGLMKNGQAVTVGMSVAEAFKVFRDSREGGFEDDRLPSGFSSPYRARSWEAGAHGFGVITYQDQVVMAMYQENRSSFERAREMVRDHQERMGRVANDAIAGKRLNYWFWEQDGQRIMILAHQQPRNEGVSITAAMGDAVVMTALGMSAELARKESERVDRLVSEEEAKKPVPANSQTP